jgi:hypothetical protein
VGPSRRTFTTGEVTDVIGADAAGDRQYYTMPGIYIHNFIHHNMAAKKIKGKR